MNMEEERKIIKVSKKEKGERLDRFLTKYTDLSRERIKGLIKEKYITINGIPKKPSYTLQEGDSVSIYIPPPKKMEVLPEEGDIEIIYEDRYIAVINKPAGISVHPSPGVYEGTLVNILLSKFKDLSGIGGIERPGIVHRLDKDTSGIMLIAKEEKAHLALALAFKERRIQKTYLAVVHGIIEEDKAKIDAPIGRDPIDRKKMKVTLTKSKEALTYIEVIKRFKKGYTYIKAYPKTGRTHQIRVHLSYIGHPLVGDQKYLRKKDDTYIKRHALHAYNIKFTHPITKEEMEFSAEIPSDFRSLLSWLEAS